MHVFPQRCLERAPCLACDETRNLKNYSSSFFFFYTNRLDYFPRLWIRDVFFPAHAYYKHQSGESFLTTLLRRYRCLSAGLRPEALIMSRFMELRDFGDAATFLRKTNLEQLAAQSHAFDGTVIHPVCVLCEKQIFYWCTIKIFK